MVQRSGHSTCGYHGWSPWRTCCLFCSCGKGLSREPQQQNFSFTQLSQPEIFFGVVFNLFAWYFLQSWPKATPRTLQWLFSIFGTYLEASLVAIVFSEYFPLFRFSFFNYCFPVNFAREGVQFQTDQLYIHSCLVCVCVNLYWNWAIPHDISISCSAQKCIPYSIALFKKHGSKITYLHFESLLIGSIWVSTRWDDSSMPVHQASTPW